MKGDFSRLLFTKLKHFVAVLSQQGRVLLDAEQNEEQAIATYLRESSLTDLIGSSGVPLNDLNAFNITGVTANDFTIQAGHLYVNGMLVINDGTTFNTQPYRRAEGEAVSPPSAGNTRTDLVYLEVWRQHVTALEEPTIREKALNIPDTTTRLRTLWRVHLRPNVGSADCDDAIPNFPPPPTAAQLTNSVSLAALPEDPCVIAPDGGFRLLENRLLRVEIHKGSNMAGGPTAKWSAENAAVVYGIAGINPLTIVSGGNPQPGLRLTLTQQARDQFLSLSTNDLVEIVSGEDEIRGMPGVLGRVHERISATLYDILLNPGEVIPSAYLATPLPQSLYTAGLTDFKVRRWDGLIDDLSVTSALGNTGVSVTFASVNPAHSGDYWVFAGRTANVASADESIEKLTNAPPHGVPRHYARLALIRWNGSSPTVTDCRPKFPPLTGMVELHYVSGDGQEISSDGTAISTSQPLKPLIVRVSNGGIPLPNLEVNFVPAAGSGTVTPLLPAPATLPMRTDANGLASVNWIPNPNSYRQQVTATLVANPMLKVVFNANLSIAAQVGYSPKDPSCYNPSVNNVKDALDQLCQRQGEPDEPGIRIYKIKWAIDGAPAENNSHVPLPRLLSGLIVETDQKIEAASINRATCYMVLEIPMEAADPGAWFIPVVIRAHEDVNVNEILWKPSSLPASLFKALTALNGLDKDIGLLARFTLKGNFIRSADDLKLYLDGENFGVPDGAENFNLLPLDGAFVSGNKRRGGDFYMWFKIHEFERIGFIVRSGDKERELFKQNFAQLIALYGDILDRAIDRQRFDVSMFSTVPDYQPLSIPFDLPGARKDWQQQIVPVASALAKGQVLVFLPESLQTLGEVLCDMWNQIEPNVNYEPVFIADDQFSANLLSIMEHQAADNRFALLAVSHDTVMQTLVNQHPLEFNMQQFKPV